VLAALVASALAAWEWKVGASFSPRQIGRLLAWFTWPAWPLVAWALWRWRHHLKHRHISVPLGIAVVGVLACVAMGGSDRALMLALPPLAVLAAFALPTLQRSVSAAIDWFSVFFFTLLALVLWVVYGAMHTGVPAKTLANVMKLAPGFTPSFSIVALAIAVLGTAAWLGLVRWRTGRHQHALWKSMVLPASGVALCWLLLMTLGLPLIDYARSYRPLVERIGQHVPREACIAAPGQPRSLLAALEYFGNYRVDGRAAKPQEVGCDFLITSVQARATAPEVQGWKLLGRVRRPTERDVDTAIYERGDAKR
jgi:4-amino-4-deoxy-L-arabinose transferase-like glycosyltransferase